MMYIKNELKHAAYIVLFQEDLHVIVTVWIRNKITITELYIIGLSRYIGLLVYCDISLKRYNISVRKTYRDISLLL